MNIEFSEAHRHADSSKVSFMITIDHVRLVAAEQAKTLVREVLERAADAITKEFVEQNKAEILAKLNPIAVANLAIADAARGIREELLEPKKK